MRRQVALPSHMGTGMLVAEDVDERRPQRRSARLRALGATAWRYRRQSWGWRRIGGRSSSRSRMPSTVAPGRRASRRCRNLGRPGDRGAAFERGLAHGRLIWVERRGRRAVIAHGRTPAPPTAAPRACRARECGGPHRRRRARPAAGPCASGGGSSRGSPGQWMRYARVGGCSAWAGVYMHGRQCRLRCQCQCCW